MQLPYVLPDQFHPGYYLQCNPDVAQSPYFGWGMGQAERHYRGWGINEGRSPNPFFYPHYYMQIWGDLPPALGANNYEAALEHWLNHGIDEGRRGSPLFDPKFYLSHHPDLVAAFGPTNYRRACQHWMEFGLAEGRRSIPEVEHALFGYSNGHVYAVDEPISSAALAASDSTSMLSPQGMQTGARAIGEILDWALRIYWTTQMIRDVKQALAPTDDARQNEFEGLRPLDLEPGALDLIDRWSRAA